MGFDNECISSIQSLPGEYFCPVCRTLIYPNEALQTQCTHLYCKPCLAYVVATTKACPYDGYLVTEADSKPLMESNKTLAETIGKVTVHCLYHKSGCQWHGTLSACITHGTTCAYGNSPVICNRCGTQIVHRQVQEHAQLCNGVQSQTQQTDGTQVQPAVATQAVTQDPSLASAGSAAGTATTLPSTTATVVADSASATGGGAAGATTASTTLPPSFSATSGSGSQTPTAEQCYQQQQLQYSQYYHQQHPGCNPYVQQYQQYGQYQHVYQQYPQPPLQVPSQNMMQGSAQPATYVQPQVQSSQPQYMMQSQPQSQPHLPHFQLPAGQSQPHQSIQPAPQVPQLQPQSQVPLQLSGPQVQPAAHTPAPTPVGNQQFAITSTQAMTPQVQPHVRAQPPQQQHANLQALPPQQNLQPQMQLNTQTQPEIPQAQQQSYPQPQAYAQQTHHMHPQNASYPQQQIPHGALLQQPVHTSRQEAPVSQHPAPMRPPVPGQQPAMLPPQGIQQTTQNQQHIGYHAQWPPMQPNIAFQAPQQGLPPQSSVSSQSVQPYQQGTPLPQQLVLSQPGQPYTQQHIPGNTGHVQTSSVGPASHLAPPQQFQHQQPTMLRTQSPAVGQPFGQGSLDLETRGSKSGKSENTSSAADNTAVSENKNNGAVSTAMRPTTLQSLGDENMNSKQNGFGGVRKDAVQTGFASHGVDGSIGRGGIADRVGNSHGPVIQGGKDHKASDASTNHEKGRPFQQISQQNAGQGSYVPPGMGPQHPTGPDRLLPQHMMHPGHKHGFSENNRPPLQQPYGLFHSGMTPRPFGENQIQMPTSQPGSVGMIRPEPHMVAPLPGHHDAMLPPFVEHLGHPPVSGRAFHEEGFNSSGEHLRSHAAYPGRHDNVKDRLKQFPGPAHLDGQGIPSGPRPFESALGRPDGFLDSIPGRPPFPNQRSPFPVGLHDDFSRKPNATAGHPDFLSHGAEFDHHRADGMPIFRNPGPFAQGMSGGSHGPPHKVQLGSGNLPGNLQHSFGGPEYPPTRFNPGHMHPGDPNLVADYAQHGFPKELAHFGLGGPLRNGNVGWCRICMFNCGSAENLDLHVQTREHQQCAMDIVLKMKQDVAKRSYGGPKSFHNKKVAGKGHFRGNRR
ncbi:hypothetical protein SEVIR_4G227000v4 [Setaria viridis]|uniref:RING-type domain-containing protein n=1 Tax=Setaria viridis TaxID=4556 RepID=A0A4U6V4R8_SETVI|nr:hypothetical protein SEVIR_4G227000v2 [Setaria viridis]